MVTCPWTSSSPCGRCGAGPGTGRRSVTFICAAQAPIPGGASWGRRGETRPARFSRTHDEAGRERPERPGRPAGRGGPMHAREEVFEGSCLCGAVRYRIAGRPGEMWHCHCTDCRKSHGAAFSSSVQVDRGNFKLICGDDRLVTYEAKTGTTRSFCGRCGSNVSGTIKSEPDSVYVT